MPVPGVGRQSIPVLEMTADDTTMSFFVRAKYDFNPTSPNMLRFQAGSIIEVLGQLESGWWDGLLNGETRGWFPSNYVQLVSDEFASRASTRTTVSSPRLSVGSSTSESNRSYSFGPLTEVNYPFQIDIIRKELSALTSCTTLQTLDPMANPEKEVFIDKLFRGTDRIFQNLRYLLISIHWQLQNSGRKQDASMSRFASKRIHAMAKELQSLILTFASLARELSRILLGQSDFLAMHSELLTAQTNFRECGSQIINTLSSLQDELIEEHILEGPPRSESPVSMETRSPSLFSFDVAPDSPMHSSSLPMRLAFKGLRHGTSRESLSSSLGRLSILSLSESEKSPMMKPISDLPGSNVSSLDGESTPGSHHGLSNSLYLRSFHGTDIIFSDQGTVKGATIEALVIQLTRHDYFDHKFTSIFIFTYRSFTTAETFIGLLMDRFKIQPPDDMDEDLLKQWHEEKRKPIQLRVVNVIKLWLECQLPLPDEVPVLDMIEEFFTTNVANSEWKGVADAVLRLVSRAREGKTIPFKTTTGTNTPTPILPISRGDRLLLDLSPVELARQLTIREHELLRKITARECMGKAWTKSSAAIYAKNVVNVIGLQNKLTSWVSNSILEEEHAPLRCLTLSFFIELGNQCLILNNFSTMWGIVSALNTTCIFRLRKTWALLSAQQRKKFEDMNKITDASRNYHWYRQKLADVLPPCVPFFGIYAKDLTFIEDGNADKLPAAPHLINFGKRQMMGEVFMDIRRHQAVPYNLCKVDALQDFLTDQMSQSKSDEYRFERSMELEPRLPPIPEGQENARQTNQLNLPTTRLDRIPKVLRDYGFL